MADSTFHAPGDSRNWRRRLIELVVFFALWMIYFFMIGSVPAGLGQMITLLLGLRSLFQYGHGRRAAAA